MIDSGYVVSRTCRRCLKNCSGQRCEFNVRCSYDRTHMYAFKLCLSLFESIMLFFAAAEIIEMQIAKHEMCINDEDPHFLFLRLDKLLMCFCISFVECFMV